MKNTPIAETAGMKIANSSRSFFFGTGGCSCCGSSP